MRGYDVFCGEHYCFVRDAGTALRYAAYWASVGCDALFFEAEEFGPGHAARYGRVSENELRSRLFDDPFIEYIERN